MNDAIFDKDLHSHQTTSTMKRCEDCGELIDSDEEVMEWDDFYEEEIPTCPHCGAHLD